MRMSPSCGCCFACDILLQDDPNFHDSFTIVGGTWTSGTESGIGWWETSDATSAILETNMGSDSGAPWEVGVGFDLWPEEGDCIFRVYAGGSDAFIEMQITYSGGRYYSQMKIGKVSAGGYYGEHPYDPYDGTAYQLPIRDNYLGGVALCWNNEGTLTGSVDLTHGALGHAVSKRDVTMSGTIARIEVIALSGTIRFSGFNFRHSYSAAHPECPKCYTSCAMGIPLASFLVRVTDESPHANITGCGGIGEEFPNDCTIDCVDVLGTHTVNHDGAGDGECHWESEAADLPTEDCTPFDLDGEFWVEASATQLFVYPYAMRLDVKVWTSINGEPCAVAAFREDVTTPPEDWNSWIELSPLGAGGICVEGSDFICEIKKVA